MPDPVSAVRFSLNTDLRVSEMLDMASPAIIARLDAVKNESLTIRARNRIKAERQAETQGQIAELGRAIAIQEKAEREQGPARKEIRTPKQGGGETVEVVHTGELDRLRKEQAKLVAELQKDKITRRTNWFDAIMAGLAENSTRELRQYGPQRIWQPNEGEDLVDGYKREWNKLCDLTTNEDKIWNAPRTVAEVTDRALAEMLARTKPIDFGGFRRGHSFDNAGNRRIATPNARVGFPEKAFQAGMGMPTHFMEDGIGLFLAWLGPKKVEAMTREQIRATYNDEGAMTEESKRVALAEIGAEIWEQRRVVEAAYCYCRDKGITNLNRPKSTPIEIILDVKPLATSPMVRLQNVKPVEPEGDFTASDFEGEPAEKETVAA